VERLLADGALLNQIVLLSYAGRERSSLLAQTHLGKWALKSFTGQFDSAGNAKWRHGELLADTLHRFKGQAAPVVLSIYYLPAATQKLGIQNLIFFPFKQVAWRY
jgi:hypothetical protein